MASPQPNADSSRRDRFARAQTYLRDGDYRNAQALCEQGLQVQSDDPGLLWVLGRCLIAQKRLQRADALSREFIEKHPDLYQAHELRGDLQTVIGDTDVARACYDSARRLASDQSPSAIEAITRKVAFLDEHAATEDTDATPADQVELAKAETLKKEGRGAEAEALLRRIIRQNPQNAEAMRQLAAIASEHFEYGDAVSLLNRAVEVAPRFVLGWLDLTRANLDAGDYPRALESAEQVVNLNPDVAQAYIALANAQSQADDHEAAIASYKKALSIAPDHDGAFSGLAHQLKTVGRQNEAVATHRKAIASNPRNTEAYWNLANLKTFRFEDQEVRAMEQLAADGFEDPLAVSQIHNALGLEYEGRKDYDRAFEHFRACNEARRSQERYDPVATELQTRDLMEVFTEQFLDEHGGGGCPDRSPILIVGLPRSGSTLLEQILASHSQVEGTHELSDLPQLMHSINRGRQRDKSFPLVARKWTPNQWREIGERYITSTAKYRTGKDIFIDKNPNNFVYAGLLRLALPNARIVNARRHPMDSCFGTYKQLFASGQPFSYDLGDIGEYYLLYQELMDHWDRVMPGAVLTVQYEEVVADLEGQVRRLLEHCKLPFEDACLEFHNTRRAVRTASSEQVRRPIYASSVDLWKNYAKHLGELEYILEPLLAVQSA